MLVLFVVIRLMTIDINNIKDKKYCKFILPIRLSTTLKRTDNNKTSAKKINDMNAI